MNSVMCIQYCAFSPGKALLKIILTLRRWKSEALCSEEEQISNKGGGGSC